MVTVLLLFTGSDVSMSSRLLLAGVPLVIRYIYLTLINMAQNNDILNTVLLLTYDVSQKNN